MRKTTNKRVRRLLTALGVLLALSLTLPVTALAVNEVDDQGEVPQKVIANAPIVSVQGNVVVDNGKPTGYYELALCVRSARKIVDNATGLEVTDAAYAADLAVNPDHETDGTYTVSYYGFSAAAATVGVNADVLTAVNWDVTDVVYNAWDAAAGAYAADNTGYPRGIDLTANIDPEIWPATGPDPFPDVTAAKQGGIYSNAVALDAEGDRSMFTATAQAEDYYEDIPTGTKTVLVTLSAHAPDNKPVVFTTDTPVAVVRFSYDLKRFPKTVVNADFNGLHTDQQLTGDPDTLDGGFWLGLDRGEDTNQVNLYAKTPLTWLADTDLDAGARPFSFSDSKAAQSEMGQVVWTKLAAEDGVGGFDQTEYYYYLGAEHNTRQSAPATIQVSVNGVPTAVSGVALPQTEGAMVLTQGTDENDPALGPAGYTYFHNVLRLKERTLKLKLVNEPTFRKPAGTGGTQILFYDWDDTLIGSMIVGKGDVRAQVNAYVEKNMVHPDLRTGDILQKELGGALPDLTTVTPATGDTDPAEARYKAITDSTDREWTYRGKYSSKVDGSGVVRDETDPEPGKEYVLTNKLDYAFYRHINTVTTLEYQNASGNATTDRYITTDPVSSNADAALYPWVYGWAIVEDNSPRNQAQWQVRRDAAQVENTWTTIGVGELSEVDPAYDLVADPDVQTLPTTLPGPVVPGTTVGGGTGIETTYPAFIDPTTPPAPPASGAYSYALSGESGYLRFADFSDMTSQLTRPGQNVLVVKAVYEPGPELLVGYRYRMIEEPYYNKLRNEAANNGGAYSIQVTLERATEEHPDGHVRGVNRVREAVVRQDTTVDQKWIEDTNKGVNHDLENADKITAQALTQTTFTKVDIDNGEEVTFTLALSARQHRVDYWIMDSYNLNFVGGVQRSGTNYERTGTAFALDNYNYYMAGESDENDAYFDPVNYADREGSRGFVLYGTLNRMMELATQVNRGASTENFIIGVAYDTMTDANLRDSKGDPASVMNEEEIQNAILAAAKECEQNHYGDPDFWNNDLDCAELTYHQVQHYISGKGLLTRAAADADKISWCHLHKDCAAAAAGVPKTWDEMVAAAKKNDVAAIEKMMPGDVVTITNLRSDAAGGSNFVYNAGVADNFASQFTAAVQTLDAAGAAATWDNVQYVILNPGTAPADDTYARAHYWWYDKSTTNPPPTNLAGLVSMAKTAATNDPTLLPDGVTPVGQRTAKLRSMQSAFDSNDNGTEAVSPAWKRITENLVMDADLSQVSVGIGSTTKFTNFDTFLDQLLAGVQKGGGTSPDSDPNYWYKLQYVILHPDQAWPASPLPAECADYYWHNGGKLYVVKDIATMLEVAKVMDAEPSAAAAWAKFDFTVVQASSELLFAQNFTGTLYDASTMASFKTTIANMVKLSNAPTLAVADSANQTLRDTVWSQIQYYLIHNTVDNADALVESEAGYYWWKDGGSPIAPAITAWNHLFNAAFLEEYNGNTLAWDKIGTNPNMSKNSRFRNYDAANPPATPIYDYASLPLFTADDLQAAAKTYVKTTVDAQITAGQHAHTVPVPTWFEMQHYLVNGSWDVSGISQADLEARYWWFDGKTEDPNKPVEAPNKPLTDWIAAHLGSDADVDALTVDDFKLADMPLKATVTGGAVTTMTLKNMKTRLKTLLSNLPAGTTAADLTWYQIQVALWPKNGGGTGIGNGEYTEAAAAKAAYETKVTAAKDWRPQWVKDFYVTGTEKGLLSVADLFSLDMTELPEADVPLVDTPTAADNTAVGADIPTGPVSDADALDPDALQARIDALERELAALRELQEALTGTGAEPSDDDTVGAGVPTGPVSDAGISSQPTVGGGAPTVDTSGQDTVGSGILDTPTSDAGISGQPTVGDDVPTGPASSAVDQENDLADLYHERPETPLGEEAQQAEHTPVMLSPTLIVDQFGPHQRSILLCTAEREPLALVGTAILGAPPSDTSAWRRVVGRR